MISATRRTGGEAPALVRQRVASTLAQVARGDIFPHAAPSDTGVWTGSPEGNWTSGFWAGLLRYDAALSSRAADPETAAAWTLRLAPHLARLTHDIGFAFSSSAVLGWEMGRDPASRDLALRAADVLAAMVHPATGAIPVGSRPSADVLLGALPKESSPRRSPPIAGRPGCSCTAATAAALGHRPRERAGHFFLMKALVARSQLA